MPRYDYECVKCHKQFEVIQHMNDPIFEYYDHLDRYCCKCDGHVERKISVPTIKFIGSGFYVNDYKKNK